MPNSSIIALLRKYIGVTAVYFAMMLTVLDGTIMNVALPTLTQIFGAGASATVWIVNAYQLVITMLLLSFASVGDIWGYRRVFLIGVLIFTIASALCVLAWSLPVLISLRVMQGIGAAAIMSVNVALIRMIYPPDKLGRGLGFNALVVAFSTVTGPTLAGSLLAISSWHWLFLINLPFGIAALLIGRKHLPRTPDKSGSRHFDWISAAECALMLGLLVNAVEDISRGRAFWIVGAQIAVVIVLSIFLVRRQKGRQNPLLPVDLLKIPLFAMSVCTSICSFAAQMLAMVSLPFLLQDVLGHDPLQVGLLMAPWPIGVMIAAFVAGRLVEHIHGGLLGSIGMVIFASGLLLLFLLPSDASDFQILWRMFLCGIGFGTFQTPNNVTIASSSPMERSGAAGGMQGAARVLGQTLGTTGVAIIFRIYAGSPGARISLIAAMGVALTAAIMSGFRLTQPFPYKGPKE